MNRRLSSILLLAFVAAAATSYLVYRLVETRVHQTAAATPQETQILVAARDLQIGTLLRAEDLTTAPWVGAPPKGAVTDKTAVVNRGVVSQIYQGEPILDTRLAAPGAGGGLAAIIRPGMRACAIRVDDVVGVAGFVLPGMRVDVLASGTPPGANQSPKTKTLLQNIEVLSAGANIQKDNEGKPVSVQVVNLLVTPEQAELLSLASGQTRIQLVLRNPLDTETPKTPGVAMASVLSDSAPAPVVTAVKKPVVVKVAAPPPPPPPPPAAKPQEPQLFLIQVYNGAKHSEEKFDAPQK